MSALDSCCVFMKELCYRYKVAAELQISANGAARICIQREFVKPEILEAIPKDALNRGFKQGENNHWLVLHG